MSVRIGLLSATIMVYLASAGAAWAQPGLANKVEEPYVTKGLTEVEVRGGGLTGGPDGGDNAEIIEVEHGFTDHVSFTGVANFDDGELESLGVETIVNFGKLAGLDVGFYADYMQPVHNGPGEIETKFLFARRNAESEVLFNLILQKSMTSRPGEGDTEVGYAAQATMALGSEDFQAGIQAFGDVGTGHHSAETYVGPVAKLELDESGIDLEAAYLFALGDARNDARGQWRIALGWERKF